MVLTFWLLNALYFDLGSGLSPHLLTSYMKILICTGNLIFLIIVYFSFKDPGCYNIVKIYKEIN